MASKHEFPYGSFDAAVQDGFKKLGTENNKAEAFALLRIGYYQKQERKLQNSKRQEREDRVNAILEHVMKDPTLKKEFEDLLEGKATTQLGRKWSA